MIREIATKLRDILKKWWGVLLAAGVTLGILNNYLGFAKNFDLAGWFEPNIQGIWLSEYSYPIKNGSLTMRGTTEYFSNYNYNFVGEAGIVIAAEGKSLNLEYFVDGAGIWEADKKTIKIRLNDIESSRKSMQLDGKAVDPAILRSMYGDDEPFAQISIPRGKSEEYKIIDIAEDVLLLEVDDPAGNPIKISMKRQTSVFQR